MAFDQSTRNRLARFVSDARTLLAEEFTRQLQNEYGLDPSTGDVTPLERLSVLDNRQRETARILRETMEYYLAGEPKQDAKTSIAVLNRILREQAFTVLNRMCAMRMAEAREIIIESISNGYQSKGFQLYTRLAGSALGETGDAYRTFLFSLMDEFAVDLPVLFDRFSPQGRLFPRENALLRLLDLINNPEIEHLWIEDETIGWIYQFYNTLEERQEMRANRAPQNSRELAVRNQFFTPRYVVEFLTDNTLGRLWYEMTKGDTSLKDSCCYLVRRPIEIFLDEGEEAPGQTEGDENLSPEELLRQPVYIPHRPLKDPREIKMLDPACGSMHFGLYAFDLFEQIYEESWDFEENLDQEVLLRPIELAPLHKTYPDKVSFLKEVPRLIIEHNIHGVDIDKRAVQIAGLSLWLRAQKSWQGQGLQSNERPRINKSNIVCAEPMPGDRQMLEDFLATINVEGLKALMRKTWNLSSDKNVRATPQMAEALVKLVRTVWGEMELAGEAGSLLKVEETLRDAISLARKESEEKSPLFRVLEYGLNKNPQEQYFQFVAGEDKDFFDKAEELVLSALKGYIYSTTSIGTYRRKLFAGEATEGFAFIDLLQYRYDILVMNPPFGDPSKSSAKYINLHYKKSKDDILTNFIERALDLITPDGLIGAITNRTSFYLTTQSEFREKLLQKHGFVHIFADFGYGVLDAMVETAAYTLSKKRQFGSEAIFVRCLMAPDKRYVLEKAISSIIDGSNTNVIFISNPDEFGRIKGSPYCYWIGEKTINIIAKHQCLEGNYGSVRVGLQTGDDWRFLRLSYEVPPLEIGSNKEMFFQEVPSNGEHNSFTKTKKWAYYSKTEVAFPWFSPITLLVNWEKDGYQIKNFTNNNGKLRSRPQNQGFYFSSGFSYMLRSTRLVPYIVPKGVIPTAGRAQVYPNKKNDYGLLGYFASLVASGIARLNGQNFGQPCFQAGMIQNLPVPNFKSSTVDNLKARINNEFYRRRSVAEGYEPYQEFTIPGILKNNSPIDSQWSRYSLLGTELEEEIATEMGLSLEQFDEISRDIRESLQMQYLDRENFKEEDNPVNDESLATVIFIEDNLKTQFEELLSYSVGVAFGRWDVRLSLDQSLISPRLDAFDHLPECPPGMLKNECGLPASPQDISTDYPVPIIWSGILTNDQGQGDDIVNRIREVFQLFWNENADNNELKVCEALGICSVRDYFEKPTGFFSDHLKRYSMNRRQAPIYWPLSTPSNSYTLWLYYHRINDQILYTCVNDFVDPKLKKVSDDASRLRLMQGRSSADEKELERLSDLEQELRDFREELLRVAKFWKPNLNDGVEITASPLWKLFQYKPWQKRLKATWQKLENGDYDWAHLAYSIWPERVHEKCKTDKSLAIAHDLEELYVEPPASTKKKRTKVVFSEEEEEDVWFDED